MMSKKSKRSIVISVRLDDTSLAAVDLLVNSGLAQSRSEAASQFIGIGVQSSGALIVKAKVLEENVRVLKKKCWMSLLTRVLVKSRICFKLRTSSRRTRRPNDWHSP